MLAKNFIKNNSIGWFQFIVSFVRLKSDDFKNYSQNKKQKSSSLIKNIII